MSVLDSAETVADAIRPTLDAFVSKADPYLRKVTDELYEQLLNGVQDYLRENGEWNIGQEIARCRKIEHDNTQLRIRSEELTNALVKLERDNEALCAKRSDATYQSMLADGAENELLRLDDARKYARHVLAKSEPQP